MNASPRHRSWPIVVMSALSADAAAVQVQFAQQDWLSEELTTLYPNSRVGSAEVSFAPSDEVLFAGRGGYINIVTLMPFPGALPQWSVQNWFIQYGSAEVMLQSSPCVHFYLGNLMGQKVPTVHYVMTATSAPLRESPAIGELQEAPMQQERYHVGGRTPISGGAAGGSGLSTIPFTIGPFVCIAPSVNDVPVDAVHTSVGGQELQGVQEETNGGAPGAAARALGYVSTELGLLPGICQDHYEILVVAMATEVGDDSQGTTDPNLLAGKEQFVSAHQLPISSELHYGMDALVNAKDVLGAGGDAIVLIAWEGGGGHAAMISSVISLASGGAIITYVDDPYQGDVTADTEEHAIVADSDGEFDGGMVEGFLVGKVANLSDLNADGVVNGFDLALLLGAWGPCLNPPCGSDLNGDSVTSGFDLAILLAAWGDSPSNASSGF